MKILFDVDEFTITRTKSYYTVLKNGVFYGNYDTVEDAKYDIYNESELISKPQLA